MGLFNIDQGMEMLVVLIYPKKPSIVQRFLEVFPLTGLGHGTKKRARNAWHRPSKYGGFHQWGYTKMVGL